MPFTGVLDRFRGMDPRWLIALSGCIFVFQLVNAGLPSLSGLQPGSDDMMRLQQVRDLLSGQAWYNVDQARMLTPEGGDMHWSRLPDIPIALLILLLTPVLGPSVAETAAIFTWPLILGIASLFLVIRIARNLGLSAVSQAIVLLALLGTDMMNNFLPGRIDHHGLLLILALGGFSCLVEPGNRARTAILLATSVALLASVALEGMLYAVLLTGLLGLFWVVRGHAESERMTLFGACLFLATGLIYLADAPGLFRSAAYCDAFSLSHLLAFMTGGVAFMVLGTLAGNLQRWTSRLLLGLIAGAGALTVFAMAPGGCLGDPYAAVSPAVREVWLSQVEEARRLDTIFAADPAYAVSRFGYVGATCIAAFLLFRRAEPAERLVRFALLLFLVAAGSLAAYQYRAMNFATAFAAIAAGGLIVALVRDWLLNAGPSRTIKAALAVAFLIPANWQIIDARFGVQAERLKGRETYSDCRDPSFYRALDLDRQQRVFSPIDLGLPLLIYTPHKIYAAPYHRNDEGIARVANTFLASPDAAHQLLLDMGAEYFLYCRGLSETRRYARTAPSSLADLLESGQLPAWLIPVSRYQDEPGGPAIYRISGLIEGD